jgi:hypothetical protein
VLVVESAGGSVVVRVGANVDEVMVVAGDVVAVVVSGDVVSTAVDDGVTSGTVAIESASSDPHPATSAMIPMSRADRGTNPV